MGDSLARSNFFVFFTGSGPENILSNTKYARSAMPPVDPTVDAVIYQQINLEYYTGEIEHWVTLIYIYIYRI